MPIFRRIFPRPQAHAEALELPACASRRGASRGSSATSSLHPLGAALHYRGTRWPRERLGRRDRLRAPRAPPARAPLSRLQERRRRWRRARHRDHAEYEQSTTPAAPGPGPTGAAASAGAPLAVSAPAKAPPSSLSRTRDRPPRLRVGVRDRRTLVGAAARPSRGGVCAAAPRRGRRRLTSPPPFAPQHLADVDAVAAWMDA